MSIFKVYHKYLHTPRTVCGFDIFDALRAAGLNPAIWQLCND